MCRFSSKSSLLAGVSAVVLAASVGSGAFAQTAVDYTKVGERSALRNQSGHLGRWYSEN